MNTSLPPMRLESRDTGFRLSVAERAQIPASFDSDALERLLSFVQPAMRADVLGSFQVDENKPFPSPIVQFTDPVLQGILEEVFAPMWVKAGLDAVREDRFSPMPGKEVARRRLDGRGQRTQ